MRGIVVFFTTILEYGRLYEGIVVFWAGFSRKAIIVAGHRAWVAGCLLRDHHLQGDHQDQLLLELPAFLFVRPSHHVLEFDSIRSASRKRRWRTRTGATCIRVRSGQAAILRTLGKNSPILLNAQRNLPFEPVATIPILKREAILRCSGIQVSRHLCV